VSWWKRGLLAVAGACALWSPSARWGHPEDAVAVGLILYAVLALANGKVARAGWLSGAAICVQPLVLLALPMMVALLPWRRMVPFLIRGALPSAALLAAAGIANWHAMYTAVTSQPNSPIINHPTAWTSLAPHMADGNVAAGPFRLATIVLACCCAVAVRRRWGALVARPAQSTVLPASTASPAGPTAPASIPPTGGGAGEWDGVVLAEVLWFMALALALRSFFEPVMVSYYPWPPLAVALVPAAAGGWFRLIAAGVIAGGVTAQGQGPWHNVWAWWVPLVTALLVLLAVARRYWRRQPAQATPPPQLATALKPEGRRELGRRLVELGVGGLLGIAEVERAHRPRGEHVDVHVRHLQAGDDQACPGRAVCRLGRVADLLRHGRHVPQQSIGGIRPLVDLLARHD